MNESRASVLRKKIEQAGNGISAALLIIAVLLSFKDGVLVQTYQPEVIALFFAGLAVYIFTTWLLIKLTPDKPTDN